MCLCNNRLYLRGQRKHAKTTNEFVDEVINLNTSKDSYINGDYENDTITDGLEGIPVVEVNRRTKK